MVWSGRACTRKSNETRGGKWDELPVEWEAASYLPKTLKRVGARSGDATDSLRRKATTGRRGEEGDRH